MKEVLRYHISWRIHPQLDLIQMSGVLCGLVELERGRVIRLSTEFVDRVEEVPLSLLELVVHDYRNGDTRAVAIDFYDQSDKLVLPVANRVDVYFKRQYTTDAVTNFPHRIHHKVRPLGLTLCGFSRNSWKLVAAAIAGSLRTRNARRARSTWRSLISHAIADSRLWFLQLPPGYVATIADKKKIPRIVFQPRLWDTRPGSGDVFDVANSDRIATVMALRKVFGSEDSIGLVHSPTAARIAPHLQLSRHLNTREYFAQLRNASIAVNCTGLSGSIGWKFAEYLAAGSAVVSQPIDKVLVPPIEADSHYLIYRSPQECVDQCVRLLKSPGLAEAMGNVNRAYFDQWVHPKMLVLQLLRRAFETP